MSQNKVNEIVLDTRDLEAPEPMGVVLENLKRLNENTIIRMIHRIEPLMLYTHLTNNNFKYNVIVNHEDEIHIIIWHNDFKDNSIIKGSL